jgi:hypothetical protein
MTTKLDDLDIEIKLNIIVSQTAYTIDEAKELLETNNGDYIKIVMDYLKKDREDKKSVLPKTPSINQNIYRQIRNKMNENMDVVIARMSGTHDK